MFQQTLGGNEVRFTGGEGNTIVSGDKSLGARTRTSNTRNLHVTPSPGTNLNQTGTLDATVLTMSAFLLHYFSRVIFTVIVLVSKSLPCFHVFFSLFFSIPKSCVHDIFY